MGFQEKYISASESLVKPDPLRITLSDDAYAQCEAIDELMKVVERIPR